MITPKKVLKGIFIYIAATLLIGIPWALISGFWLRTKTGWIIIIIFVVPFLLTGEFIGEKLFSDKISDAIDPKRKNKQISLKRMLYAFCVAITFCGMIFLIMKLFGDRLKMHFYFS